jgi:amino acid adenylation domain-containing protein
MRQGFVHEVFSGLAEAGPGRVAIEVAGGASVTYGELEAGANRLANYMFASGAGRGAVVAVVAESVAPVVASILASLKAGCVFVPLDPRMPPKRMEALLAEVSPALYVAESAALDTLAEAASGLGRTPEVVCLDARADDASDPAGLVVRRDLEGYDAASGPGTTPGPDDMCYVYFTSGSTGRPKGIAGRLKAIDHFIRWEAATLGLSEGVRVSQLTTPSFDAYLRDVFVPLCTGGTVCAPPGRATLLDARRLVEWVEDAGVNLVHCVPSLFRTVLHEDLRPERFPALRHVLLAGEPLLPADVRRWMGVFGERIRLVNLYGPSETTMVKFFHFVTAADGERRSVPIGKPMEGAKAILLDEKGAVCPPGAVGEIYIRTPYRALGYFNRPELTREVFVPNPFNDDPDDLIYKTGDLARLLEDGSYEFLGRKDQQVKIRGVRVEPREIEDLLLGREGLTDAAVVDLEDGGGGKYLCAYVVGPGAADHAALRAHLLERLPDYLVPSAFVTLEALPRTLTGKVDRKALPAPGRALEESGRVFVAPRTETEGAVAAIWSEVLGLERVGVADNFFALGGHSLLATQVISRVRLTLGVDVPLASIFESPTVAGLAAKVEEARAAGGAREEETLARLLESLEQLPEDEARARLKELSAGAD